MQMSPFMYADKVKHPILLIHGQADNNSGTDPMQSERFFNALKGHGATARLVFLPLEAARLPRPRVGAARAVGDGRWMDAHLKKGAGGAAKAR